MQSANKIGNVHIIRIFHTLLVLSGVLFGAFFVSCCCITLFLILTTAEDCRYIAVEMSCVLLNCIAYLTTVF